MSMAGEVAADIVRQDMEGSGIAGNSQGTSSRKVINDLLYMLGEVENDSYPKGRRSL